MNGTAQVLLRLLAAVAGGWGLSAAVVPLAAALFAAAGMARSEAAVLAMMLGFLFYAAVLIWAFAVRSLARLWIVMAAATALSLAVLVLVR